MKNYYEINKWLIIITVLLWFTLWGGMITQIVLGVTQIAMSIKIMMHFTEQSKKVKDLFITYIFTTVLTIVIFKTIDHFGNGGLGLMLLWIIVTMFLALFHLYITYKIKISNDQN